MNQNTSLSRITPNHPTSGSRESEEQFELTREQQRKQERLWNTLHEQRITLVHATERHIRALTEETQAETDKVEMMRKERR